MRRPRVLLASLLMAVVAGCSSEPSADPAEPEPTASAPTEGAGDGAPLTLAYDGAGERLADVYLAPEATDAPVVVLVHGVAPDPSPKDFEGFVAWGRRLAERGIAAVVPNLRVDELGGDEGADDVSAVLELVEAESAAWGVDPTRVAVLGFSAGGRAAVRSAFEHAAPSGPVRALAVYYGLLEPLDGGASPSTSLSAGLAHVPLPTLVAYGAEDATPGVLDSVAAFEESVPAAADVTTLVHPDAGHAFDAFQPGPETDEIVDQTLSFLEARLVLPSPD